MRKLIVLSLAGLLILAFSATGYAQAPKLEFKASGWINFQSFLGEGVPVYGTSSGLYRVANPNYQTNAVTVLAAGPLGRITVPATFGIGSAGWNKTQSNWEGRAHLKFDAVMGPNLSGTIYFEIDTSRWGSISNSTGFQREANNFGAWTTDRAAVEVKNIYIDVGLPYFGIPVPITMRIGAQPIGVRPNMLVYSDGTGITAGIKIDPVLIAPIYAKALENADFADDDVDVWGLHASAKIGTFSVGGYGLYYRMNTYPFNVVSANLVALPALGTGIIPTVAGTFKSHMWWFGVYADGKAGPVNLNYDFVYDYGSVDERNSINVPDVRYRGWATRLNVSYPWDKFNFGVTGMYASGSNARHTSEMGLPGTPTNRGTNTKYVGGYVVPPASEQGPVQSESMVVYSMESYGATGGYGIANNANYTSMSRGGFGGTWFAKVYGSVKPTPWYKVTVQGLYIGDTTEMGNTFGNAVKYRGSSLLRNDTSIGWELNLLNEIQIYQNLRFWVGAGYLIAGPALDINMNNTGNNRAAGNPWAFRTSLMYVF
jgi:hypothetical protein